MLQNQIYQNYYYYFFATYSFFSSTTMGCLFKNCLVCTIDICVTLKNVINNKMLIKTSKTILQNQQNFVKLNLHTRQSQK